MMPSIERSFAAPYDFIIDAIDLVSCKLDLISQAQGRGHPHHQRPGHRQQAGPPPACAFRTFPRLRLSPGPSHAPELKAGAHHLPVVFSPRRPPRSASWIPRPRPPQRPDQWAWVPSPAGPALGGYVVQERKLLEVEQ